MKKRINIFASVLLVIICSFQQLKGQENTDSKKSCGVTNENSQPYFLRIGENIRKLREARAYKNNTNQNLRSSATPTVKFIWPLKQNNVSDFTYYRITNYVDLDTNPEVRDANDDYVSGRLDYNCGTRNYDGHNGLDIAIMPYGWKMQYDEKVSVVAAANGIIVDGDDGNYDENCDVDSYTGPVWGNWIGIMHDDSTVSVYVHLKKNSVIPRTIGQRVNAGQFLGYVASSGRSSGPHLHFGVYINNSFSSNGSWTSAGDLVEPFNGSCNNSLASFWQSQKPYNEPSVISIETYNAAPEDYTSNCDKTITLPFDKTFSAGNIVYTRTWFRDWVNGSNATIRLFSPSGTQLASDTWSNSSNGRSRYFNQNFFLAAGSASGTYTVQVTFDGKQWERYFTVGCVQNYSVTGTITAPRGYIAGNTITTTQVIESGADNIVEYHADNEIVFSVGFHAKSGSTIIADRKGCTGGYY